MTQITYTALALILIASLPFFLSETDSPCEPEIHSVWIPDKQKTEQYVYFQGHPYLYRGEIVGLWTRYYDLGLVE